MEMSLLAQIATRIAAVGRRAPTLLKRPIGSLILLLALALLAPGCRGVAPSPQAGPDPADPRAPVPRSTYRSTLGPYTGQRPVDPTPWRERNEGVAPAAKR
jgi:hypothetical protein